MLPQFDSAKSLISHSKEDIADLQRAFQRILRGDIATHIIEIDPETGNKTYKIKFTPQIPSRCRYTANNALNNLRHSLDQSLVGAVEALTKRRSSLIYFPFATSPSDLDGRLAGEMYRGVPTELHPALKSFEPYPRSAEHFGGNDFLCAISKIVGPNKHQVTLSPNVDIGPEVKGGFMASNVVEIAAPFKWDIAKQEAILGTVTKDGYLNPNYQFTVEIVFGDAGPMFRHPVIAVLHQFASVAKHIVFGLEAETERIISAGR